MLSSQQHPRRPDAPGATSAGRARAGGTPASRPGGEPRTRREQSQPSAGRGSRPPCEMARWSPQAPGEAAEGGARLGVRSRHCGACLGQGHAAGEGQSRGSSLSRPPPSWRCWPSTPDAQSAKTDEPGFPERDSVSASGQQRRLWPGLWPGLSSKTGERLTLSCRPDVLRPMGFSGVPRENWRKRSRPQGTRGAGYPVRSWASQAGRLTCLGFAVKWG